MNNPTPGRIGPAERPVAGVEVGGFGRIAVFTYIATVAVVGAAGTVFEVLTGPSLDFLPVALFCGAAAAAEWFKVRVEDESPVAASLTLSVIVAAMVTFGPGAAALAGISAVVVPALARQPRPLLRKVLFNSGMYSICASAGGIAYAYLGGRLSGQVRALDLIVAMLASVVYLVINWGLLMVVVRMTTDQTMRQIWDDLKWMAVQMMAGAALGFALGAAYRILGWLGPVIYVAPMIAIRESMRMYTSKVHRSNEQLVEANHLLDMTNEGLLKTLGAVIDARDVYLYGHSLQASKYAGEVARRLVLSADDVRIAELGALLHDIGKIGIKDAILNKPARLTPDEYTEIKAHCEIGYELLSNLPGFEAVAEVVRCHHERWDGAGYPRGLKGVEIPIGARIVSVVEAVEAMVSDRPYRKGMTPEQVLHELAEGAGTQWDADVVRVFSEILSKDQKHLVMRNSALEIALNRAPLSELVDGSAAASDPGLKDLTTTFSTAAQPIFILDDDYRIVSLNPMAERLTGFTAMAVEGRDWSTMCAARELQSGIPQTFFGTTRNVSIVTRDGAHVEMEITGTPLRTSSATYWLVLAHDVSARVKVENDLKREARTDFLTKLATRAEFEERAVNAMRRGIQPLSLVMLDLDELKAINDTHGHLAGDRALSVFARILATQLRETDLAARFGGDEFVVLMPGSGADAAGKMLGRLAAAVLAAEDELTFRIDFCAGHAEWDRTESLAEMVARADLALYDQKRTRRDRIVPLPTQRASS
ncbi:MAG: hypothetical protein QOE92_1361, partial [Chloroflexota bacterium]|nr:hypothetical protein [Chloroflexota bacterium]